ncbi:MAG: hypothetical protein K8S23_05795 [Candidatus Cloacimonetes bacterium]|nr:hypothetical protein [Candidatus Cloacimonadota bacterium]
MNKILIIVLLIITGCGVGFVIDLRDSDQRDLINLVYNSGFESGDYDYDTTPEDWIVLNKPLNKIFWDNGESHNGEKCVKIKHPDRKISLISEAFSLNPEAVYQVKCFLKSQKDNSKSTLLTFSAFDKNGKKVNKFSKKIYPNQSWSSFELNTGFLKSSAKFGRITFIFPKDSKNVYWVDDVETYFIHSFHKRK